MSISYKQAVFLYCFKQLNAERSIYSLFHLFQGKKSAQTIQDAHFFKLTSFFLSDPLITRVEIDQIVGQLYAQAYLCETVKDHFQLTKMGHDELREYSLKTPVPPSFLAGWEYHHLSGLFWDRLSLLIQVSSNLIHYNKGFIPVHNKQEGFVWLKSYLKQHNIDRHDLASELYKELVLCLSQEDFICPSVLVLRLTGFKKIGLTPKQIAEKLKMEELYYHHQFLNTLHYLISAICKSRNQFPYLSGLISEENTPSPLTLSTKKTYEFLKMGYSLKEITHIRNLKMNTIEDHIVEIALHVKSFDLHRYVEPDKAERIIKAAKELSSRKLRDIRQKVEDANYFEIRLVLARNGG
ncbi:helix-turn-helix domain-containing protein [Bacillus sp. B15-48]|uniref:helix-turn-helix domain-containing protein n=1 Tax=Bacillus sp. B15-48 TaxID=1548601 RepID=UPI00193ECE3D|nr:helix-turn-helix domain-containing protein [Bacillus sp. B15-48]MBM4762157.1 RQC domain-containing protein [Bacillus sp. B15-48]